MSNKIEIGTIVSYEKDGPRNKGLRFHGEVKELAAESNGIEKVVGVWVAPLAGDPKNGWVWIPTTEVTPI